MKVLVDLRERRVTRVVAIDESIELDVEEGAREQTTLAALSPAQTANPLAIAARTREPWPATEAGSYWRAHTNPAAHGEVRARGRIPATRPPKGA